jgi:hypothetical protein
MINRIFFISDTVFQAGENLPASDNIYFSILVNPSEKENLENVYGFMDKARLTQFALTLDICELPSAENIRFITSFLFLPSYLNVQQRPVINVVANSQGLVENTAFALSDYLSSQGVDAIINKIFTLADQAETSNYCLFNSSVKLVGHYKEVLQSDQCYNNTIFFYVSSMETFCSTLSSLQQVENDFRQSFPNFYSLASRNMVLELDIDRLKRKISYTEAELSHHKQYNDILRSEHSTSELQNYYNHEYEILPKWYKRLGHILKVITGKRTFRSLVSDNVKKYKD